MRELVCVNKRRTESFKTHNHNPPKPIPMAEQSQLPPRTSKDPSGLKASIKRLKKDIIKNLLSKGSATLMTPEERARLLGIYHKPDKSPSGLSAEVRQKILVISSQNATDVGLQNGDPIEVTYTNSITDPLLTSPLNARVKRVSEYPNDDSEFTEPSLTILIEWGSGPKFIGEVTSIKKNSHAITILGQTDHADNFIINPRPPISEPDPPVMSTFLSPGILALPIAKSDFRDETYDIIDNFPIGIPTKGIKVVVSDTGLKFNLNRAQEYQTSDGHTTHFPIAGNPTGTGDPNRIGFCSLTNYLDDTYPLPPRNVSFPDGIPTDDVKILRNPHDDHEGRHGTTIAAIVAHNPAGASEIVPLKIFDFLGFGTLFDILCGFNYIFSRIEAGENIRIVNASWGAGLPGRNYSVYELLRKKIKVLEEKHVFVIAAAGNRDSIYDDIGHNLTAEPMVPACYSGMLDLDNVITVTSVAEIWEEHLFNRTRRSHYLNQALQDKLLATGNWLERLLNLISNLIPNGYEAVENYSNQHVQVGVVAHPLGGFFPTPFGGTRQLPIAGSSFATAFMSAYVVGFLTDNPRATRAEILASLKTNDRLKDHVQEGRYLELDTVTGRSIDDNFESVLRAILSNIS